MVFGRGLYLLQCREVVELAHNALAHFPSVSHRHKVEAHLFKFEALILVEDAVLDVHISPLYLGLEVLKPEAPVRLARPLQRTFRQLRFYFFACHSSLC